MIVIVEVLGAIALAAIVVLGVLKAVEIIRRRNSDKESSRHAPK